MAYVPELHHIEMYNFEKESWDPLYGTGTYSLEDAKKYLEHFAHKTNWRVNPEFARRYDPEFVAAPIPTAEAEPQREEWQMSSDEGAEWAAFVERQNSIIDNSERLPEMTSADG